MTPYQKYAAQVVFWLIILPLLTIFCVCKYIDTLFPPAHGQGFSDASAPFLLSTSSLRKGLVGYWRLEEPTGTRYDCSPNANHLTPVNGVGRDAGKVDYCSTFVTGSTQYLTNAVDVGMNITNAFTICFWVRMSTKGVFTEQYLLTRGIIGSNKRQYHFWTGSLGADSLNFAVSTNGTTSQQLRATTFGGLFTNDWNFVCGKFDSTNQYVSINNGAEDTKSCAGHLFPVSDTCFCIGRISDYTGGYLSAYVDEVGIWNRVLTAAEITSLYNAGRGTHFPWSHK